MQALLRRTHPFFEGLRVELASFQALESDSEQLHGAGSAFGLEPRGQDPHRLLETHQLAAQQRLLLT
ncbi:MAG: hypothetical protein ACYTFV_06430 [Planctomycetota bacterium]